MIQIAEIFTPHELKTIEVDVEKKIFRVNGEDFGHGCTEFEIRCSAGKDDFFKVNMRVGTTVNFSSYDRNGNKRSDRTIERNGH